MGGWLKNLDGWTMAALWRAIVAICRNTAALLSTFARGIERLTSGSTSLKPLSDLRVVLTAHLSKTITLTATYTRTVAKRIRRKEP